MITINRTIGSATISVDGSGGAATNPKWSTVTVPADHYYAGCFSTLNWSASGAAVTHVDCIANSIDDLQGMTPVVSTASGQSSFAPPPPFAINKTQGPGGQFRASPSYNDVYAYTASGTAAVTLTGGTASFVFLPRAAGMIHT